jgi:hypothetical protein
MTPSDPPARNSRVTRQLVRMSEFGPQIPSPWTRSSRMVDHEYHRQDHEGADHRGRGDGPRRVSPRRTRLYHLERKGTIQHAEQARKSGMGGFGRSDRFGDERRGGRPRRREPGGRSLQPLRLAWNRRGSEPLDPAFPVRDVLRIRSGSVGCIRHLQREFGRR